MYSIIIFIDFNRKYIKMSSNSNRKWKMTDMIKSVLINSYLAMNLCFNTNVCHAIRDSRIRILAEKSFRDDDPEPVATKSSVTVFFEE